ncbi:hypothetical protein BGZ70_006733 [Mortierella alpina]|uniref:Uncharacterized protein n=1 Tax=Mortierella alpina TaxID=64518 RepID=A0A9P6M2V6_MORAP|nr:hypothetical protein BGZ70_006733 [Mortierella alpina]
MHAHPSAPLLILIIRIMLITLSAINLCALAAGLQIYPPSSSSSSSSSNYYTSGPYFNFQDTPQLATNALLFLAITYAFLKPEQWSPRIRAITGVTLVACNLALVIDQFHSMALNGGCEVGEIYNYTPTPTAGSSSGRKGFGQGTEFASPQTTTTPMKRRCHIQMVIGIASVVWGLLLLVELMLTNLHHKRDTNKKRHTYRAEEQECPEDYQDEPMPTLGAVHYYHPDLTLHGSASGSRSGSGRRTREQCMSWDIESLPAYEPRVTGPRPQIVDMANLGQLSPPARIHPRTTRVPRESRTQRAPRESRTGIRPPSYSSHC